MFVLYYTYTSPSAGEASKVQLISIHGNMAIIDLTRFLVVCSHTFFVKIFIDRQRGHTSVPDNIVLPVE